MVWDILTHKASDESAEGEIFKSLYILIVQSKTQLTHQGNKEFIYRGFVLNTPKVIRSMKEEKAIQNDKQGSYCSLDVEAKQKVIKMWKRF